MGISRQSKSDEPFLLLQNCDSKNDSSEKREDHQYLFHQWEFWARLARANYAATKGGMISFTKSLARELGPFNIRVNAVARVIESEVVSKMPKEKVEAIIKIVEFGRSGSGGSRPGCSLLASEHSNYITGQTLVVDGGIVLAGC